MRTSRSTLTLVALSALVAPVAVLVAPAEAATPQQRVIIGTPQDDYLDGTRHADSIRLHGGDDFTLARAGHDEVWLGSGDDIAYGDAGVDEIMDGTGADRVYGGDGRDRISNTTGRDWIGAGPGNDTVWLPGGDGVDEVHCGSGHDTVIYNLETDDDDIAADCEEVLLLS